MRNDRQSDACYVVIDDAGHVERRVKSRRFRPTEIVVNPWSYAAKRGRGRIRLTLVEYRILRFLAARPNRAVTRNTIAEAVSTASQIVTVETLADYVRSLRGQLGF